MCLAAAYRAASIEKVRGVVNTDIEAVIRSRVILQAA
jgi:hypothetical protein